MTLRDDVRQYFENESRSLPTPDGLRSEVTAKAAAAPGPGLRHVRWEAVAALGLAIAIVVTLIASGSFRHQQSPTTGPAHPTATPRQVHLAAGNVLDADLVTSSLGWSLAKLCSFAAPTTCRYLVVQTTDGGRSWSAPSLVADLMASDEDALTHIHFFNQNDGFVYGSSTAFETTDGGKTWSDSNNQRRQVVAVVGRDGLDWMVERPCAAGAVCSYVVQVSDDGGRTWTSASPLPAAFTPTNVVAFSVSGLLLSTFGVGNMLITLDGGASWRQLAGRCSADSTRNSVATFDGQELWQLCIPTLGNAVISTHPEPLPFFVSSDGGNTWDKRSVTANDLFDFLVPVGPRQAILVTGVSSPYITSDGGLSWQQVQAGDFVSVAVCSTGAAWARDADGYLWFTADARPGSGSAWATLPSQP
jgi:photosystem II stability/assembly factor-like uncharacterized protein